MKKILLLATMLLTACTASYENLDVEKFGKTISDGNVKILDVRTPDEYAQGHIPGSILIDVESQDFVQEVLSRFSTETPLALYCKTGIRSRTASEMLCREGYKVYNLETGIKGWMESGKQITQNDMKTICEFIKSCGHYFIATMDGDQPRVRPFGTINIFDGKLYIQTGHKKRIAQQLKANGKAELCAFNGQKWVRVSGTLIEDTRVEAKKSMLDAYPELRSMYDENDENTAVYYFENGTAYFSSFTEPEETINF